MDGFDSYAEEEEYFGLRAPRSTAEIKLVDWLQPWRQGQKELSEQTNQAENTVHLDHVQLLIEGDGNHFGEGSIDSDTLGFTWYGSIQETVRTGSIGTPFVARFDAEDILDISQVELGEAVQWNPTVQVQLSKRAENGSWSHATLQVRFVAAEGSRGAAAFDANQFFLCLEDVISTIHKRRPNNHSEGMVTAVSQDLQTEQTENISPRDDNRSKVSKLLSSDGEDDDFGRQDRRHKSKKNDRRGSISFDALNSLLSDEEEAGKSESTEETVLVSESPVHRTPRRPMPSSTAQKTPQQSARSHLTSDTPEQTETFLELNALSEDDQIRALVRAYVKDPERNGFAVEELLRTSFNYELNLIPSPTPDRLANSPPTYRQPAKSEIRALKPIVQKMGEHSKHETAAIESATMAKTMQKKNKGPPTNHYIDIESNSPISPREYERRYMQKVIGNDGFLKASSYCQPTPSNSLKKEHLEIRDSTDGRSSTPKSSARGKFEEQKITHSKWQSTENASSRARSQLETGSSSERSVVVAPMNLEALSSASLSTPVLMTKSQISSTSFEDELAHAEDRLYREFDEAMNKFLETKLQLEIKYKRETPDVRKVSFDSNQVRQSTSTSASSKDDENEESEQPSRPGNKQDISKRRKSILLDDLLDEMSDKENETVAANHETSRTPGSKRVLWSAKGAM